MGTTSGGWRIALRLARREALRRKGQTALMLVLICLPVLAVTAAAIVWRTQDVSGAEGVDRRMGSAAAVLEPTYTTRVTQPVDPAIEFSWEGDPRETPQSAAEIRAALAEKRSMVRIVRSDAGFETDRGIGDMSTLEVDLADPLADGLLDPVRGKYPPGPGEVVVNQALADRGPGVGDTLVVRPRPGDARQSALKVVGIAESTAFTGYPLAAAAPGAFDSTEELVGEGTGWLVDGGAFTWSDVQAMNEIGVLVASRAVLTDPPPASVLGPDGQYSDPGVDELTITVLALVAAMVLIEVVLLAGPAFAVRAKAQAHALALVAAAGGSPAQARRTVLASGVVVGVVGGLLGVALGLGIGAAAVPVAQHYDSTRFGPFEIPWPLLALVAGFGLMSAVLAAVVPAFLASRQDVVAVLAGRRGEGRPSGRTPIAGLVLLGLGITAATLGAVQKGSPAILIAGAAIISVIGMILVVPLAVTHVARLAARMPLTLRFAARDAARHRTRTVPAIAAVGATVAGVVALGIAVSSQESADRDRYQLQLPIGQGAVTVGDAPPDGVAAVLRSRLPQASTTPIAGAQPVQAELGEPELTFEVAGEHVATESSGIVGSSYLVGSEVPDYLRVRGDRDRAAEVLAAGGVVVLRGEATPGPHPSGPVTVIAQRYDVDSEDLVEVQRTELESMSLTADGSLAPVVAVLSPEAATGLGLRAQTTGFVVDGPISGDAEKDITEALAALPSPGYFYVERGYHPDQAVRIIQLVLAALGGILMLGGTLTATFLALSDARPDLATMAAVGARPRTRRGVAASYALVVGVVGAVLGAPVGFIPGIAVSRPLTRQWDTGATYLDIPWLLIGIVVVGLPLLTAAVVGACARGRLPLVARID